MLAIPERNRTAYLNGLNNYLTTANRGLIFERFYNGYNNDFTIDSTDDTRELHRLSGLVGDNKEIANTAARRIQLASKLDGQFGIFSTDWHMVTGMGHNHPTENGFSWHTTLGTPYIPGSTVKGLLRAWMEEYSSANKEETQALVREWFGGSAKEQGSDDQGKAGEIIFFDAIPVEQPVVGIDIMTPHMGKWYEKGGEQTSAEAQPGDWHSPVPVTFIVTKNARFLFSIAPRKKENAEIVKQAFEHLKSALAWLGVGSKTASGYGHMSYDENDTAKRFQVATEMLKEQQQAQKLASLPPEQVLIEELRAELAQDINNKKPEPGGNTKQKLRSLIDKASEWPTESKLLLRDLATEVLVFHDGDKWKKKDKPKALYQTINKLCE